MFSGVPLTFESISLLASTLRMSLDFQPNAGSAHQRGQWFQALDESLVLAQTPAGPVARFLRQDDWNLRRARSVLEGVREQATTAGLLIAQPGDGFASNFSRFGGPSGKSGLYAIRSGRVRKESEDEAALRLVRRFIDSPSSSHNTLLQMLDRSIEAHIGKLQRQAASLEIVAISRDIPKDAAYPRDYQRAHPALMEYLRRTLIFLNDGENIPWRRCAREIVELLVERFMERENLEASGKGLDVVMQIPNYSAFQLLCLLIQIGNRRVDPDLAAELKTATNGRTLSLELAKDAEIRWRDLLVASELMGNIDVIHSNIRVADELALSEQPRVDPRIVRLQVRAAVARLGLATKSSRPEYEDAIARLKKLEEDPDAGRVIELKARNP